MASYQPIHITGNATGLVQEREEFLLPNDAYPFLENAYVWRERIMRKKGCEKLGRIRRILTATSIGNISAAGAGTFPFNIFTGMGVFGTEPNASLQLGTVSSPLVITIAAPISQILTDTLGLGTLVITGAGPITVATINYSTGVLTLTFSGVAGVSAATITGAYFPGLPVMGLNRRELNAINQEETFAFDTKYAYRFINNQWEEYFPGFTWTGTDTNFFWSTNYWVIGAPPNKLFWVTNNYKSGTGDYIRYTAGTANSPLTWNNFGPTDVPSTGQINSTTFLNQARALLPFRGRLVAFNTWEGADLNSSTNFFNRIRWSQIGDPLVTYAAGPPATGSWRSDIRGKGGFLDIPTSEAIVSVGFVRDNLVVYCERSTWQLRYTGRSISPFQIEKVNSELGAQSTFSAIQFDTSLVGIGDKGIVECDSFKSELIDVKIPDLVMKQFNNTNTNRVYGVRDFVQRLAYWMYTEVSSTGTYPNRRLIYNYENDSWAIFIDSFTVFGTFQPLEGRTWANTNPDPWVESNYTWYENRPKLIPDIIAGNQQGYTVYIDSLTRNDPTLMITGITGANPTATVITSPNHNLRPTSTDFQNQPVVVLISGIPTGTPFASSLNGNKFGIQVLTADTFKLWKYNPADGKFSIPQTDSAANVYVGGAQISVLDNFSIVSKKFSYLDQGQNIQLGYLDILMDQTTAGEISLNVYVNYNDNAPSNIAPQNTTNDTFFNFIIPTSPSGLQPTNQSKILQRVICPTRGNFLTLEYTLTNGQMVGEPQRTDVQIDAQILWQRPGGQFSF